MFSIIEHAVHSALLELLHFAIVPVLHGAIITGYAAVNLCLCAAMRTSEVFACDIAMLLTDRIGGRHCIVRKPIILRDLTHQRCSTLPVGELFTKECMEYST